MCSNRYAYSYCDDRGAAPAVLAVVTVLYECVDVKYDGSEKIRRLRKLH